MTIRSLRTASMLLCALPLTWTACGGSDAPETTPEATPEIAPQPGGSADTARSGGAPAAAAAPAFSDTEWRLLALEPSDGDPIEPAPSAVPTIQFNSTAGADGVLRTAGFAGCNFFISDYTPGDGGSLTLPAPVSMTQMACDESIMKLETAVMKALAGATGYSLDGGELTIRGSYGSLRFGGG